MDPQRLAIGLPILAVLLYGMTGWCLVITTPETLIDDLDQRGAFLLDSKPRFMAVTLWALLRRMATWPAWYR